MLFVVVGLSVVLLFLVCFCCCFFVVDIVVLCCEFLCVCVFCLLLF